MGEVQDTEITLGTGKLLAMFFGLVVICAVFFGLGYSLGRGSSNRGATVSDTVPQPVPASTTAKPAAAVAAPQRPADANAPSTSDELTFYKSVEQRDTNPQLPAAAASANGSASSPSAPASAPELTKPAPGAYLVQVAAVSKKEDADILLSALQKKQYPVFITTADNDKLFHVQVGPFSDQKEAESMKAKLTADGYSPILKK